ncbi:hypothetical protein WA171_000103 [Blastocystis sp. BT1]
MELSTVSQKILAPKRADLSGTHTVAATFNPRNAEHPERPHLLTVAENVLCWEHMQPYIAEFSKLHPEDNMYATSYDGRVYFKECMAKFLTDTVFKTKVTSDNVIIVAGSGAVMDIMSTALMNPGEAFICITPCYNSFNNNFSIRNGAVMYKADTTLNNYVVTDAILEEAYAAAERDHRKVKMLVFTNPNNPTGTVSSVEEMHIILQFCRRHNLHLFSDEIYALSVKPAEELREDENKFVSFAKLIENDPKKDDVTCLWGFSKDMGLSGFRLSVLMTHNQQLHTVLNELIHFCEVPANTQSFATNMLSNQAFMNEHISLLQHRVWNMRQLVEATLHRLHIPIAKGYAGFFSWMNLREYLKEDSYEGEQELYEFIYEHGNIIIAPGTKYNSHEFGWYRWIFTCEEEEDMKLALKGLEKALRERKLKRDHSQI